MEFEYSLGLMTHMQLSFKEKIIFNYFFMRNLIVGLLSLLMLVGVLTVLSTDNQVGRFL